MRKNNSSLKFRLLYEETLGLRKAEKFNYFADKDQIERYIPIGTIIPYSEMDFEQKLNPDYYVWFPINPKEVTSILVMAQQRMQKTRLVKRFTYYFQRAGYNVGIFDPKGDEFALAGKIGDGSRLHPHEKADKMRIINFIPPFITPKVIGSEKMEHFVKCGNDIRKYNNVRDWLTLKFAGGSSAALTDIIRKGQLKSSGEILEKLSGNSVRTKKFVKNSQIRNSILLRLTPMHYDNFFDNSIEDLDVEKVWQNGNAFSIHFFTQDKTYISEIIGKKLEEIHDLSEINKSFGQYGAPKLFVCDDAFLYAYGDNQVENLSVNVLINCLFAWAYSGFNMIFVAHDPTLINKNILGGCKHKFISFMGNANALLNSLSPEIIEAYKNLEYKYEQQIVQYLWIHPDNRTYEVFYPLGAIVGH